VFEQIELIGLLKCTDREAMYNRLRTLIRILGLHRKTDVLCSALTGGELKRVSVGMGMISNPSSLFLDEPTTGLDSAAAFSIVKHLVELARDMNVAVIMTIHQPSEMVFDMLQDLLLLEGGRLAYTGPLPSTERYFKSLGYNCPKEAGLADFYLDLVYKAPESHQQQSWKELYATSVFGSNMSNKNAHYDEASPLAPAAVPPPSTLVCLYELLVFFFKYYTRDQGFYFLRIAVLVGIAFFLGKKCYVRFNIRALIPLSILTPNHNPTLTLTLTLTLLTLKLFH
jgi:ABC-type multidrug transport system ATPase subunit